MVSVASSQIACFVSLETCRELSTEFFSVRGWASVSHDMAAYQKNTTQQVKTRPVIDIQRNGTTSIFLLNFVRGNTTSIILIYSNIVILPIQF